MRQKLGGIQRREKKDNTVSIHIALLLAQGTTYLCYPMVDQVVSSVASIVFNTNCSTAGTSIDIFVSSHCGSSGIKRCPESLGHNFSTTDLHTSLFPYADTACVSLSGIKWYECLTEYWHG